MGSIFDNGGFIGRTADYSDTSFYEYFPDIDYNTAINSVSGGAPDFRWTLDATTNEEGSHSTTPTGTFSYTTGLIQTVPGYQSADMSGFEYLTIANDPLINGGTGYVWTKRSISFWFNADTTGSGTYPCIWEEGGGTNWMSIYLDSGLIYANVGESSSTGGHATASVSTGTTYHCLVTFDLTLGSNNIKIYLNGSLAGQATSSVGTDLLEHVGDVRIGSGAARNHLNADITYASFDGRLQDVCYWNEVALTATDASNIYNAGLIVIGNKKNTGIWNLNTVWQNTLVFSPASLFEAGDFGAFYDFNNTSTLFQDTSGTNPVTANGQSIFRVNDLSGSGNDLTAPVGAPTWNSSGWAEFDGVNDYLTRSISPTTITDFTVVIGIEEISRKTSYAYSFVAGSPVPGRFSSHIAWSDGNYYFDVYDATSGSGRVNAAATVSTGVPLVASHSRNGSAVNVRTNGSTFGNTTISNSITLDQINLAQEDGYHGNSKIFAFFFIDRALSASDLQLVEDWIAERNGAY